MRVNLPCCAATNRLCTDVDVVMTPTGCKSCGHPQACHDRVKVAAVIRYQRAALAEVDEVADDEVSSRSEVIRRYVDEGLARDRRKRERMQG